MKFKLRKLCSSTEEYEANADSTINLDSTASNLSKISGIEVAHSGFLLTILFEDLGAVIRLYPSGRAFVQANLREDAERACEILGDAVRKDNVVMDDFVENI